MNVLEKLNQYEAATPSSFVTLMIPTGQEQHV